MHASDKHQGLNLPILQDQPSVAIIVPCLNERTFIEPFLRRILAMDYFCDKISFWIVDGMSTDGTREILARTAVHEPRVHVLDNPHKTTACALNLALGASDSDVVVRLDVHTDYPLSYVSRLVVLLKKSRAGNVGGVRLTSCGNTAWENSMASLISAPFANGGALWRSRPKRICEVESVYCGCYPRAVFEQIGYFDEAMIRIEDREFNSRLRQAGGRIVLDPRLTCMYHPRTQLAPYLNWTFSGPFRIFYSRRLTKTPLVSARNLAPMVFVLYQLALPWAVLWLGWRVLVPLGAYFAMAMGAAGIEAWRHRRLGVFIMLAPLFYVTHVWYGAGSLWGWMRSLLPLPPPIPEGKFTHK